MAKWIPSSILEMFACYDTLPRPEGVETFFVPAVEGAPTISFGSALRSWCKKFIDSKHTWPTVNDYRKMSHKVLMELTQSEEKLKSVMKVIDAHGKYTQDKHYILREPEEDVKLAEMLAKQVHGEPSVMWPSDAELNDIIIQGGPLGKMLTDIIDGKPFVGMCENEEQDDPDDEGDAEEMSWWDIGGTFFLVPKPNMIPLPEPLDAEAPPISDTSVSASSSGTQVVAAAKGTKRNTAGAAKDKAAEEAGTAEAKQ